jgi:hypothetical protein
MNDELILRLSRRSVLKLGGLGVAASAISACNTFELTLLPPSSGGSATDWLHAAQWGVFSQGPMVEYQSPPITTVSAWNAAVNAFDVEGLANQIERMGAGYLILCLGENSGFYCSPNATYDSIVGYNPSHMSTRDLVSDLYAALNPRGIPLMVYLPAGAPDQDQQAVTALQWRWGSSGLASFQVMWDRIIQEWSTRWGSKVAGWWFDGCFYGQAMYNWDSFAAAARSGNSASIVAFNPGVQIPIQALVPQQDYTAGETDKPLSIFCDGRWIKSQSDATQMANTHVQFHCLTYAGSAWGTGQSPNYSTAELMSATNAIVNGGGAITWDMPLSSPDGLILSSFEAPFALVSDQLCGRFIVNDTSDAITYGGGNWTYSPSRGVGDWNDDVHVTTENGAFAQFTFNGSGLQILSERDADMGNVAIYINGELKATYDCYFTGGKRTQQVIYDATNIGSGTHTVKLVKIDGACAILDAFRVLSTSVALIDDSNSEIVYSGSWAKKSGRNVTDVLRSIHYTQTDGDHFEYKFTGTGIQYITENGPDMGNVEVFIDDASQGLFNCYSMSETLTQQPVFSKYGLSAVSHSISVYKRSGTYAILDALRVFS